MMTIQNLSTNLNRGQIDFVSLFEKKLCDFTGAPYCLCVDSCSHALFLALKLFPSQEIECPSQTYLSVPMQIIHAGHKLKFIQTKWVNCYNLSPTNIFDCAVMLEENMYQEDTIQCLSFQYKKPLFVNKGGAILLDNREYYERLKRMRYDGHDLSILVNDIKDIPEIGYHYYMTPESACQGLLSFERKIKGKCISNEDYQDISGYSCFQPYLD